MYLLTRIFFSKLYNSFLLSANFSSFSFTSLIKNTSLVAQFNIFEPGYNDIGYCETSSIALDAVLPINSSLFTVTLYSPKGTTLSCNKATFPFKF